MQRPRKPSLFEAPIWKSLPYSLWAALLDDVDEDTSDDDSESSLFSSRVSSEGCLSDTEKRRPPERCVSGGLGTSCPSVSLRPDASKMVSVAAEITRREESPRLCMVSPSDTLRPA
ncbi:hypothetical protein HPB52_003376 [Rhipicephalus sanguineus]|uniref:Uncharacterized protein n=1 Tax=Rhipicephalus sanguineus TaxID=34632 RepID=A0A9D4QH26_RHISA|nr:hypothetical protein HPB52_003376 [Rhipicephalus sanguineus]